MTAAARSRRGLPGFLNAEVRVLAEACWLGRAGGLVPDLWAVMGVRTRSEPALSLVDRQRERQALDGLLQDLRSGHGRALVVWGEAGVGKSALLECAAGAAPDLRLVRAVGVESEMELAFAGLHQLCAPLLAHLERLPAPQRDALGVAFGLREGAAPDRFLVGLAVLTLLSEAAGERPLLCLVDDAQWLDRASAQVLAFVARRLLADPVGLIFAARDPGQELGGFRTLRSGACGRRMRAGCCAR
jgi:energy-coupling factor transporter ATP-binding protein EcfA2